MTVKNIKENMLKMTFNYYLSMLEKISSKLGWMKFLSCKYSPLSTLDKNFSTNCFRVFFFFFFQLSLLNLYAFKMHVRNL
jgi:hypothetical protein